MLGSIFYTNEPLVNVAQQICKQLNLKITNDTVRDTILSHPDYPSLLSVSDSLNKWNIDNAAIRISAQDIDTLPEPFIGYAGGELKVVTKLEADHIYYLDSSGKKKMEDRDTFLSQWQDVALLTEISDKSGDENYFEKKKKQSRKYIAYISAATLMVLWTIFASMSFGLDHSLLLSSQYILALIIKLAGIVVTALLIWFEVDKYNSALKTICSGVGAKSDCNAVLNSTQAKLFNWLSWSEVGLFYFTGGWIYMLLFPSQMILVIWLNILVLPFIAYSLFYQYFVIKQWCPLCLSVQGLLFLEFVVSVSLGSTNLLDDLVNTLPSTLVSIKEVGQWLIIYLLAPVLWFMIRPILLKSLKSDSIKFELNRIKSNPHIFDFILSTQKVATGINDSLGIILGNPDAENTVVKVCNPYCDPCSNAHPDVKELLASSDNVRVQIIYNTSYSNYDIGMNPVRHFLALYRKGKARAVKPALDDWYLNKNKDYSKFASRFPIETPLTDQDDYLKAMHSWTELNQITFTPTYFFNGRQLPSQFGLKDLTYFV